MKSVLLYLWQIPQNIIGLLFLLFIKGEEKHTLGDIKYYFSWGFPGGITLGKYIIIGTTDENTVKHEYGHTIQSKYLGPLYLIVIGIPSLIWATLYGWVIKPTHNGYYRFYTEKWADKLGGVIR